MKTTYSLIAGTAIVASFIVFPGEAFASTRAYRQPINVRGGLHAPGADIRRSAKSKYIQPFGGNRLKGVPRRTRTAGDRVSARSLNRGYYRRNRENRRDRSSVSERKGVIQRSSKALRNRRIRR